jgi:hypothetical protein
MTRSENPRSQHGKLISVPDELAFLIEKRELKTRRHGERRQLNANAPAVSRRKRADRRQVKRRAADQ